MKINFDGVICGIQVDEKARFFSEVSCSDLEHETIQYAVKRFFTKSRKLRRSAYDSYLMRIQKRKPNRIRRCVIIPAGLMELPGAWVRVRYQINPVNVVVYQIEILNDL